MRYVPAIGDTIPAMLNGVWRVDAMRFRVHVRCGPGPRARPRAGAREIACSRLGKGCLVDRTIPIHARTLGGQRTSPRDGRVLSGGETLQYEPI